MGAAYNHANELSAQGFAAPLVSDSCSRVAISRQGDMGKASWAAPEPLFHPQFSVTEEEKNEMLSYKKRIAHRQRKRQRQTPSLWRERPLPQRDAHVVSPWISQFPELYSLDSDQQYFLGLGRLMRCLGKARSVVDIYSYWNSLNIIATHRPHAWSKPARREAAFERMRETGHWRHRD